MINKNYVTNFIINVILYTRHSENVNQELQSSKCLTNLFLILNKEHRRATNLLIIYLFAQFLLYIGTEIGFKVLLVLTVENSIYILKLSFPQFNYLWLSLASFKFG